MRLLWTCATLLMFVCGCQPDRVLRIGDPPLDGCADDTDCAAGEICIFDECTDITVFECREDTVPLVNITPLAVEFNNVVAGSSQEAMVRIENVGPCLLTVRGVGLADGASPGFSCAPCDFTSYPMRIAPERSLEIAARYAPLTPGEGLATLRVSTDDLTAGAQGLVEVDLHGSYNGTPVLALEPSELNFGYMAFSAGSSGQTRTETVRIKNLGTGNALLTVSFIFVNPPGTAFSIPPTLASVTPAAPRLLAPFDPNNPQTWIDVPVTFAPTSNAAHEARLTVAANSGTGSESVDVSVRLAGSSLGPPKIEVTPLSLDFRTAATNQPLNVGSIGFEQVSVSNSGQSELTVELGLDDTSGQFSFAPSHLAPLLPGGQAVVSVFYTPLGPSDLANPGAPLVATPGYLRLVSNDTTAVLTTVNLHGWAKQGLSDDFLRLEMTFDNDNTSWAGGDYRDVDLELLSPLGFSCKKAQNTYVSDGQGGYIVASTHDFCADWTATGLEGQARWVPGGVFEEPERVLLFGLGADLADGGLFEVRAHYVQDCQNIPSGLLADILGIGTSALLGILGGAIGIPIAIPPGDISDLISENCWSTASTLATVHVYINGAEVAAPQVRLAARGDSARLVSIQRRDGAFEVAP